MLGAVLVSAMVLVAGAFRMDTTPVTNAEFLAFVTAHPEWRRDRVAPVFAEPQYLSHWQSPDALGASADAKAPVVNVSWFSARAYCASRGARLPTEAEWELAASASWDRATGKDDDAWRAWLAAVYSRPSAPRLPLVASSRANFWGIYDLHGVVWEWVSDFATTVNASCGSGAPTSSDAADFPAFARKAFRSSLRASYTIRNLGFRCVASP